MPTLSSTKTFPFFLPLGFVTPTGVIILSFGIPSSSSVYVFFLGFFSSAARFFSLSWTAATGPGLPGFLGLETPPVDDFLPPPESLDLGAACLFFTVRVREGAIATVGLGGCLGLLGMK